MWNPVGCRFAVNGRGLAGGCAQAGRWRLGAVAGGCGGERSCGVALFALLERLALPGHPTTETTQPLIVSERRRPGYLPWREVLPGGGETRHKQVIRVLAGITWQACSMLPAQPALKQL
jgi:hypothetical protein